MKNKINISVIWITLCIVLNAQENLKIVKEGDTVSYKEVFSALNTDRVTTGLLADKAIQFFLFDNYNGSDTAKIVTSKVWDFLYNQMISAQTKSMFVSFDNFKKQTQANSFSNGGSTMEFYDGESIPISVIDVNYEEIKKDAFEKNLLKIEKSKIRDVTVNSEEKPYLTKNLFAATASKEEIYGTDITFLFENSLYFTNKDVQSSVYEIDFDDGLGFRIVTFGQKIHISYSDKGIKYLRLRKTEKNNTSTSKTTRISNVSNSLVTTFSISVQNSVPPYTFAIPESELTFHIPSSYPYGGVQVKGTAYVLTTDGTTSIKNPFIICEGFDPENTKGYQELYTLLNRNGFAECLRENGYDVIILNFNDGGTYIERNAYLLKGLIENINARKITDNQLVVVGASMGGLVSRYALAYMEQNNINHDTRLFISFDSPQRGANIPLGIQKWFQFFSSHNDLINSKYNNLLCSTAARQMLIYHVTSYPYQHSLRTDFKQHLTDIGYPSNLRKIAISNGAGNAHSQRKDNGSVFYPRDQIVKWEHNGFTTIIGNVWAVPDNTPETMIFKGAIRPVWVIPYEIRKEYAEGTKPYDNAPGGTTNTAREMANSDTDGKGTITTGISNHCFIPTVSSLDIETSDLFYNISADQNILSKTPFDAIYYPMSTNEEHVHISEACVAWVLSELVPHNVEIGGSYMTWNTGVVKARNSITLKPGFSTVSGKSFHAYISSVQTCNSSSASSYSVQSANSRTEEETTPFILSPKKIGFDKGTVICSDADDGTFSIRSNGKEHISSVTIWDIQGVSILRKENLAQNELHLDISNQPAGVYVVSMTFENNVRAVKITKQ